MVRTKQPGGLNWQVVPDITSSISPMLQYLDAEVEPRTGVSRQTQGIDANALQNQSATAVAQVFRRLADADEADRPHHGGGRAGHVLAAARHHPQARPAKPDGPPQKPMGERRSMCMHMTSTGIRLR